MLRTRRQSAAAGQADPQVAALQAENARLRELVRGGVAVPMRALPRPVRQPVFREGRRWCNASLQALQACTTRPVRPPAATSPPASTSRARSARRSWRTRQGRAP